MKINKGNYKVIIVIGTILIMVTGLLLDSCMAVLQ